MSVSFIKRKAGSTPEEFYHHWEFIHAPLVKPWAEKHGIVGYSQVGDHSCPCFAPLPGRQVRWAFWWQEAV